MKFFITTYFIFISIMSFSQSFKAKVIDKSSLRETPVWNGKEILIIEPSDVFYIEGIEKNFVKINIKKDGIVHIGYVSEMLIESNEEYETYKKSIKENIEQQETAKKIEEEKKWKEYIEVSKRESDSIDFVVKERKEQEKKDFIINCRKKYGSNNVDKALNHSIWIGMPSDLIELAWGLPEKINTTETKNNIHYQYVYSGNRYIYVENGKVTSIQK